MTEDLRELIAAHMGAAREDLEAAQAALDAGHHRACANRAYYAAFHAGCALLAQRGIRTRKHKGVWTNLDKEFLLQDRITKSDSAAYHELFAMRIEADYSPETGLSGDRAADLLAKASRFVQQAESLLESEPTEDD